jgi:hypothetical protein
MLSVTFRRGTVLINRAAIILKATQAAADWINEVDPDQESDPITVKDVHEDCLIYLVPEEVETDIHAKVWALNNAEVLLEEFLYGWYQDEDLWPKNIGPKLFEEWFDVKYHSMIVDTLDEPIEKEEM